MMNCFSFHKFLGFFLLLVSVTTFGQEIDTAKMDSPENATDTAHYDHKFFVSVHTGGGISKGFLDQKPDSIYALPVSRIRESFVIGSDISIHMNHEFGIMASLNVATFGDHLHSLSLGDPSQANQGDILKRRWTYAQVGIGPKALFGWWTQFSFTTKFVLGLQMGVKETLRDSSGTIINSWKNLEGTRPKIDAGISINANIDFPFTENLYFGIYTRGYFGLRKTRSSNVEYQSTFFAPLPQHTIFGVHLGVTLGFQI
jgi:hypothetical protein